MLNRSFSRTNWVFHWIILRNSDYLTKINRKKKVCRQITFNQFPNIFWGSIQHGCILYSGCLIDLTYTFLKFEYHLFHFLFIPILAPPKSLLHFFHFHRPHICFNKCQRLLLMQIHPTISSKPPDFYFSWFLFSLIRLKILIMAPATKSKLKIWPV